MSLFPKDTTGGKTLHVQVLTPQGVTWEGEATAVSSENSEGPFDLLPEHAHFISLVEKKAITVATQPEVKTFTFETAVIRLIDDKVTIYANIS